MCADRLLPTSHCQALSHSSMTRWSRLSAAGSVARAAWTGCSTAMVAVSRPRHRCLRDGQQAERVGLGDRLAAAANP
jgi:hypothetical protein